MMRAMRCLMPAALVVVAACGSAASPPPVSPRVASALWVRLEVAERARTGEPGFARALGAAGFRVLLAADESKRRRTVVVRVAAEGTAECALEIEVRSIVTELVVDKLVVRSPRRCEALDGVDTEAMTAAITGSERLRQFGEQRRTLLPMK